MGAAAVYGSMLPLGPDPRQRLYVDITYAYASELSYVVKSLNSIMYRYTVFESELVQ